MVFSRSKTIFCIGLIFIFSLSILATLSFSLQNETKKDDGFQVVLEEPCSKIAQISKSKKNGEKNLKVKKEVLAAEEIVKVFKTKDLTNRFDSKVFTRDFWLALQFQESRFREKAVSPKGAKGSFQVMPIAIKSVVEYLYFLNEKESIGYSGPSNISLEMAKRISNLFKNNSQYSEAFGKIYLLSIYDKDYNLNQAPNRDVFRKRPVKEQQRLLLYSYHEGPELRLQPHQASSLSRKYVKNIFGFMNTICGLRKRLMRIGLKGEEADKTIIALMVELDRENFDLRSLASIDNAMIKRNKVKGV